MATSIRKIHFDLTDVKMDLCEYRKEQRQDFRISIGVTITAALGLAGLIAKGFGWL